MYIFFYFLKTAVESGKSEKYPNIQTGISKFVWSVHHILWGLAKK